MNCLSSRRIASQLGWAPFVCLFLLSVLFLPNRSLAQEKNVPEVSSELDRENASPTPKGPVAKGFFEILFSGGVVGIAIMLALIGCSLASVYFVVFNFLALRKSELVPGDLSPRVRELVSQQRIREAEDACRDSSSMLSFVIRRGLSESEGGWAEVEKASEEALTEQHARLFRQVEYLSVLGSISPMLGLLGTVTGMLLSFQTVAISQGAAGPAELAEGIYQALVTTVVGLIIAIPSIAVFHVLRNRVDEIIADAAYQCQHALSPLKRPPSAATPAAPRSPPVAPPTPTPPPPVRQRPASSG